MTQKFLLEINLGPSNFMYKVGYDIFRWLMS
jgi:hypothetical protein